MNCYPLSSLRPLWLLFVSFFLMLNISKADEPVSNMQTELTIRQKNILEYYYNIERKRTSFYYIASRIGLNRDVDQCRKDFLSLLENPTGDMFFSLPMMGAYLHGYKFWTPEIHDKVRNTWKTYLPYRGDTENHWVMWHTALLLAVQTWPNLSINDWANGRNSQENYDDAIGFLNSWFHTTTTVGQGEFDSPHYFQNFVVPLMLLYDFANDSSLKHRAEKALHWLFTDYAVDYLKGAYTGGHSRIYERTIKDPFRGNAMPFGYMFFGDCLLPQNPGMGWAVFGALTKYKLPKIIQRIATDRSKPYVAYEKKRVRNIIRLGEQLNPPVYKTNYMSANFSLGSVDGGLQQPIQLHTWSVTYILPNGKSDNLFSLHPYYSVYELGMFFPEELKIAFSEIVKQKGTYNKEDKWTGGSEFERTFQHKNVLIVLYDLAKETPYKHIDYYFPKTLKKREEDQNGWIFVQGGKAYIAVRPFKPGDWSEEETCYRLRSHYLKNGLVVEVFESAEFENWQAFKTKILTSGLNLSHLEANSEVTYKTSSNDLMKFRFPDFRELNGEHVDLTQMPLFESPFVNSKNGVLVLSHEDGELVIDFSK